MRTKGLLGAGVVAALLCCAVVPANADSIPDGATAYAGAVAYAPGGLSATIDASGALGALIAPFVDPVLDSVTGTLVPTINSLNSAIAAQLGSLSTSTGLQATTPSSQQADPAPNWPGCTDGAFTSSTCYVALNQGVDGGSIVSLKIPTVRGYTLADANGNQALSGHAETTHPDLSVLGVDIGDLGAITASSTCANTGTPVATPVAQSSLADASLLGGAVTADTVDGALQVSVGGTPLTGSTTVPYGSRVVTVSFDGSALTLSVPLGLSDLLAGAGINAPDGITDAGDSTLALTVKIGPGISNQTAGSQAWGLETEVGLNGTLQLGIAGLATAALTVAPTGGVDSSSNLFNLGLAVTNCTAAADSDGTGFLPPLLI